jgi:hypothetical protein
MRQTTDASNVRCAGRACLARSVRSVVRSPRQRQHVPLFRRNAAVQCIEIDLLHRRRPAALGYLEPSIQQRGKVRPGRAETLINAARAPFFRTLANLVGREEP